MAATAPNMIEPARSCTDTTGGAQSPPPPEENVSGGALSVDQLNVLVTAQCGDEQLAKEALEATSSPDIDSDQWVNDALLWLVQRAELEPERRDIEAAMATSLLEAENVEPEIPLHARSTTELLQRFKASMTLAQLNARAPLLLDAEGTRKPLVHLLELERKCQRWYPGPGVSKVFTTLGQQCVGQITQQTTPASATPTPSQDGQPAARKRKAPTQEPVPTTRRLRSASRGASADPAASASTRTGTSAPANAVHDSADSSQQPSQVAAPACRKRGRSSLAPAQQPQAGASAMNPPPNRDTAGKAETKECKPPGAGLGVTAGRVSNFLEQQLKHLQDAVYKMPGSCGATPAIFFHEPVEDADDDGEVVALPNNNTLHRQQHLTDAP